MALSNDAGEGRAVARPPLPHPAVHLTRWPVVLALLALGALYVVLPDSMTLGPHWLLLAIEVPVLLIFTVAHRTALPIQPRVVRYAVLALLGVATALIAISIASLLDELLTDRIRAPRLLGAAAGLWGANIVIFALWYWEIDRGGPQSRHSGEPGQPDLLFPQQSEPDVCPPGWSPEFVDYLFVAFTSSTAFSPTDTLPLTRRIKLGMMVQDLASLVMVGVLAARAINVLP